MSAIIIIFIIAVVCLFLTISLVALGLWHSYREEHILGSLIFLWSVIVIFLLVVFFVERNSKSAQPAQAERDGVPSAAQPPSLPKI